MRHGAGHKPYHSGEEKEKPSENFPELLLRAERDVHAVGLRLKEVIEYGSDPPIDIGAVVSSPEPEARATAEKMKCVVELPELQKCEQLAPKAFKPVDGKDRRAPAKAAAEMLKNAKMPGESNAVLVIGHEPHLAWIAYELAKKGIPIDRGELVCLSQPSKRWCKSWRLTWTIAPDDSQALAEVREKIRSKMDAAKVLGGFITALITFVLAQFLQHTAVNDATWVLRLITGALLFFAAGLYFVALFHFDTLLMPSRFWGSKPSRRRASWLVARPPSSSAWVLYQNMMRIWTWTFIPATALVGIALIAFAQSIVEPHEPSDWWLVPVAVFGAVALLAWTWFSRPRIGAED
jgi:phosphohistidine phosphatase SixA